LAVCQKNSLRYITKWVKETIFFRPSFSLFSL
jgi:hypothetical protein